MQLLRLCAGAATHAEEVVKRRREIHRIQKYILNALPYISLIGFFVGWQMLADYGVIPETLLATPKQVFTLFLEKINNPNPDGAVLLTHVEVSLKEILGGYVLALVIGIPLGLFMGWFYVVEGFARPIFEAIRPIPPVAWIPMTIFWFGIGISGKIFIIWVSGLVPCVINSMVGVKMTNPSLIQMAKTYGASRWQIFTTLCVPSALPMVFGALQISLAICCTNLVAAELLAADIGLGFLITMGRRLSRPDMVLLGMMLVGLTGFVIGIIIDRVEKRLLAGIRR